MTDTAPARLHAPTMVSALVVALVVALIAAAGFTPAGAEEPTPESTGEVVVRLASGASVDDAIAGYPVRVIRPIVASHGLYLLAATDPRTAEDPKKTAKLAKQIEDSGAVDYAEPNQSITLSDSRYHNWQDDLAVDAGSDPGPWQTQPLAGYLDLVAAHQISTGSGSVVAVLDTGADLTHPALAGHLVAGYDYVDDDADPTDEAANLDSDGNGHVDGAYGHGTFVAGIVALIAPDARIVPMRVLDSDGNGDEAVVAQAIADAVAGGADVINLSLGTSSKTESRLLRDVIKEAQRRGVVVVAAAGNDGSKDSEYPAHEKDVLSVASSTDDGATLSAFSNYGDWVDVAAPASRVFGPMPGGRYAWWAGTSMAAPQVSGQLALLQSRGLDAKKRVEAVTKHTRELDAKKDGRDVKSGTIQLLASLIDSKKK